MRSILWLQALLRGGPGNSDSAISGSLASPKPPDGGEPEEHGDEENETESRGGIQGQGGRGGTKGDKTLTEPAEHCDVHPTQITDWKPHVLARAVDVFGGTKSTSDVPDLKVLHAKIGQLTLENDCSEGAAHQGGLAERKAMINRTHALPIARPCQLLALSCSTVYYHTRLCRQRTWRWCVGVTSSIWSICLPSHAC